MKLFFSEFNSRYSNYTFSYSVYCIRERPEELPDIYGSGFLPYSGTAGEAQDTFYLARSLRVDLARFEDTSENRRVDRKMAALNIGITLLPKEEIDTSHPAFREFCLGYTRERFHGEPMPERQFDFMLSRNVLSHILRYDLDGKPIAYIFAAMGDGMLHYWYSFFDTALMRDYPLGKWLMWRTIRWAKDNELRYVYLGTCCLPRGLYKVRDHKGLEFFAGNGWSRDMDRLKALCHADEEAVPKTMDGFRACEELPPDVSILTCGGAQRA